MFPGIFLATTLPLIFNNLHPVTVNFFNVSGLCFDFHHLRTIRLISFLSQSIEKTGFSFKQPGPPSELHGDSERIREREVPCVRCGGGTAAPSNRLQVTEGRNT